MADSPDPSKPQNDLPDKPELRPVRAPQVFERRVEISSGEPRVVTKVIKEPSLSTNLGIVVRDWLTSRGKSLWGNIRADIRFCREAFTAAFAEGWWRKVITALGHLHKVISAVLGTTVLAFILWVYVVYAYPVLGKSWTTIIGLLFVILGLLVTVRVTRRFYEKTSASLVETQTQVANLTAASEDHERLIKAARTAMATARREIGILEERLKPKVEITNVFWDQYEGIGEDGEPDSFQLLRLEVTSTETTWAEVTIDIVELDGYPYRNVHLHIQHKPWDAQKAELLPGRPEYWDIVQKARRSSRIELTHAEPLIGARSLSTAYKHHLRIIIACDKGFGLSERITLEHYGGYELDFKLE